MIIVNLFSDIMKEQEIKLQEHIVEEYCRCDLCVGEKSHNKDTTEEYGEVTQNNNCMDKFLQYFPKNFPLPICPTSIAKTKTHYFNKITKVPSLNPSHINNFTEQYRLMNTNYNNRITEHFPLAVNLFVFYKNRTIATPKYDLLKENQDYLYIQGYQIEVPLTIYFGESNASQKNLQLDDILLQKLEQILQEINKKQNLMLSDKTRDFFSWVHKDYGDEIFCYFMTKFYCEFVFLTRRDRIHKGTFNWLLEKQGIARLINVSNLIIQKYRPVYSFQEQYEQRIKEKINLQGIDEIKLFSNVAVKRKQGNIRVKQFRSNIKKLYEQQKLKILKQTQKQRVVDTKTMSDDVARLFLPELKNYSSLREVLSDEQKFRKVVLKQKSKKKRNSSNYPVPNHIINHNNNKSKLMSPQKPNKYRAHLRSKTETYIHL